MIQTARLSFRPLSLSDLDDLYTKIYSDAETMKYIRDGKAKTIIETRKSLETLIEHYKKYGFGFMAAIDKSNNSFVGICGLKYLDATGEIEVGFLFEKKYWKKKYATESAKIFTSYAFEELNIKKVVAIAKPGNEASRKVLEKCGFQFQDIRSFYEIEFAYYSIYTY